MRTRQWLAAAACVFLAPLAGIAQCSNTMVTVTHETTVSGTGSMYPPYNFSFPMFDGGTGTLMEVRLMAVVTLSYSFSIENNSTNPYYQTSRVRINRYDEIISSALSQPVTSDYISPQQSFSLAPSDGVPDSGPDYQQQPPIYILDHDTVINESLNVANFIGGGAISFAYTSEVGYMLTGNVGVSVGTQAYDEMKFIISYTYCSQMPLASEVISFTAAKKDGAVDLRWFTPTENNQRQYAIEKSSDGQTFQAIETVNAAPTPGGAGDYRLSYKPQAGESGQLMFRILIKNGSTSGYTAVRVVDLDPKTGTGRLRLAPNPSATGNLTLFFPSGAQGPWEIMLFHSNGQLITRKQVHSHTSASFESNRQLAPGVYVIRAVNTRTRESFTEPLIIK